MPKWESCCGNMLGDVLQNDHNHSTRHAEPLKAWHRAVRAAYGSSGVLLEDKYHGSGTFSYASGDIYEGEWSGGEKQGEGKYFFKDSGSTFQGKWEEGSFVSGKWVYKDGSTFDGGLEDGVPAGVGVYTFMSNGLSQRGQFVDGKWQGEAITPVA